jgi:hypothetical protein
MNLEAYYNLKTHFHHQSSCHWWHVRRYERRDGQVFD